MMCDSEHMWHWKDQMPAHVLCVRLERKGLYMHVTGMLKVVWWDICISVYTSLLIEIKHVSKEALFKRYIFMQFMSGR